MQYAPGSTFNMEPLLGIPFPKMLHLKLQALHGAGLQRVAFDTSLPGDQLPAGTYFLRLQTPAHSQSISTLVIE